MQYRQLGRTGVRVSTLCLGAMNFNDGTVDEGVAVIHEALDAGINFIDTANVYWAGQSETAVGKAIAGRRDDVVLATKVHGPMTAGINDHGNSRRHIKRQCEASLRRLGTDFIDLYQLHRPDPDTPIEESLSALDDLVRQGKVHYVGFSTFPAWQTMEAIAIAERSHCSSSPVCEQPPYNILDRRVERELLPLAIKHGLGIIPWSPLASGVLTGKYSNGIPGESRLANATPFTDKPEFAAGVAATEQLRKVAEQAGLTLVQLALGWLNSQAGVTSPIIGPKDRAQLRENLAAGDVVLDTDTLAAVDEIAPPQQAVLPLG